VKIVFTHREALRILSEAAAAKLHIDGAYTANVSVAVAGDEIIVSVEVTQALDKAPDR
jgi:hypothetical protein